MTQDKNEFNKYEAMYGKLYIKQLELETQFKQDAEAMLKATLEKAVSEGTASSTKIGGKLIDRAWNTCAENMHSLIQDIKKPKRGVVPAYKPQVEWLLQVYRNREDKLENLFTLSTLSCLIDAAFTPQNSSISAVASEIAGAVLREANIEAFFQQVEGNADALIKNKSILVRNFDEGIKKRVQQSYRIAYAINRMNKDGYTPKRWCKEDRQKLGAKLMEMGIKGSGMFSIEEAVPQTDTEKAKSKVRSIASIKPNDWLINTWEKNTDLLANYAHKFIPTIIPPKPWDSPYGGGYYGAYQQFASLIRAKDIHDNIFLKEYKQKLATMDLSYIYKALNAMQATPFRINKFILEVSQQIIASGGNLGGFPQTEPYPTLPPLPEPFTEEELKEHKKKMVAIIKRNQSRQSKCLRALMAVSTAQKFSKYDRIYFPWNLDYRGRCYPIPTALSPQGDDITKALLEFAEPTPCKQEDDWKWLAIHGANLAGHDKISFADRIKWVEDNTTNIIASTEDPLGYTWWSKEAENDYPLEFLAFCKEWKDYKDYVSQHGSCVGFAPSIAIAFDGTCSGLQHFSALLRDEIGGFAVNLVPSDKVQDIYSIVAEKVNKVLTKDAVSGTADDVKKDKKTGQIKTMEDGTPIPALGTKTLAQQWLIYAKDKFGTDGITRKVCKRSVMTLAYGSKQYGFKENLLEDIIKPFMQAHPDTHPFIAPTQAAVYMAKLIWKAVSTTVVKAVEGMKFLQDLATLICKDRNVVTWITPNGLPVQQNYMEVHQKVFKMRIAGSQHRFYNQEETGNIDARAQAQGIAPNFIHSMDACHLQRVVVEGHAQGINNFAMIHDSFGTDTANAGHLFRIVRQEFVKMYHNQDYLRNFLEDVQYLLPENADIPEHPAFGKLDITEVMNSDFCFA